MIRQGCEPNPIQTDTSNKSQIVSVRFEQWKYEEWLIKQYTW